MHWSSLSLTDQHFFCVHAFSKWQSQKSWQCMTMASLVSLLSTVKTHFHVCCVITLHKELQLDASITVLQHLYWICGSSSYIAETFSHKLKWDLTEGRKYSPVSSVQTLKILLGCGKVNQRTVLSLVHFRQCCLMIPKPVEASSVSWHLSVYVKPRKSC